MTTDARPTRRRLEGISPHTWEHPADRAALGAMRAIPGFDEVVKKIYSLFGERGVRLAFQGDSMRVTERQFPRLHRLWLDVHSTLDAGDVYDLYIAQSPETAAGAFGLDKPWAVMLSGSLRLLSDDEIEFVMGHELGHILSGHALYHTMMVILARLALGNIGILGIAAMPILLALKEWYRKSELSADRAGLLTVQTPDAALGTMMRLAGGGTDEETNLNEFLIQAEEYRHVDGALDNLMKLLGTLNRTHPYLVMRAAVLRDWIEEGAYDRVMRGEYPRRGDDHPGWMEDAATGAGYYAAGVMGGARQAGETWRRMREAFDRGFRGESPDAPSDAPSDAPATGDA